MGSQLPWSNAPPKDETKWPAGSEALHPTHAMNAHEFAIHKEKEKQRESLRQFQVVPVEPPFSQISENISDIQL